METSWVDLLRRSPVRREILKETAGVRVSEHTPLARVGTKKKRSPALAALKKEQATQVSRLAGVRCDGNHASRCHPGCVLAGAR